MTATDPAPTPPEPEKVPVSHEKVSTARDRLGRGVEPVRPVSAQAAAMWDESVWERAD